MRTYSLQFSIDELFAIARLTGIELGYATPDRSFNRKILETVFNKSIEELRSILLDSEITLKSSGIPVYE
jgi:hypothetical protein